MARHTLGIHQMRVMARAVEALQPFMSFEVDYTKPQEDVWLTVKVSELVVGNNVKPLREALDGLMKKIVRIMHYIEEKATYLEIGTPIIKEYEYEHGKGFIKLQISGRLLPQVIDLARGYTRYSLDVAFKTSSPNVFKLYQYISSFRDKKQIQCNVDTLRHWLQIEDKYVMPSKIKERILDPAIRELKEKADVYFEIADRVKDGRKMVGWKFNIYTKEKPKKESSVATPPSDVTDLIERLTSKFGLSSSQAKKLVSKAERKELHKQLYAINIADINGKVKDIGAYSATRLSKALGIKL